MTNKLPVVGKRYRKKTDQHPLTVAGITRYEKKGWTVTTNQHSKEISLDLFCSLYEELPEDNQTIRENRTVELSKKVLEAIEGLREVQLKATLSNQYYHEQYKEMRDKVENLINALDMYKKQENLC